MLVVLNAALDGDPEAIDVVLDREVAEEPDRHPEPHGRVRVIGDGARSSRDVLNDA